MNGPPDIPAPVAAFAIAALTIAVCYLMLVDRTRHKED